MHATRRGIRAIAVIEAAKGILVLVAGLGVLTLIHRDLQEIAETLVQRSHLNPASHYPRIFIEAAGKLQNSQLRLLAAGALAYSLVRFVEAYGLWKERRWAEWFAAGSGAIYLPVELYELSHGVTWAKVLVILINAAVVAYMVFVLISNRGPNSRLKTKIRSESHP